MKRYEKFVLKADNGIIFETSEGTSGELIIRALNSTTANEYSANYANPPIPKCYNHICGEWNNGFVIKKCSDGSQFVWIPVGSLEPNGTIDGKNFSEKFGRRNYENVRWYGADRYYSKFSEALSDELRKQCESVEKYGGFYISRYNISRYNVSKSSEGRPQSVEGFMPWVKIDFYDAKQIASTIENTEAVKSHLTFGAEYDSVLEWFIETKVKTLAEIAEDSTKWGNYANTENSPGKVVETGSREKWCANNIYDLAGNVYEWTQEQFEGGYRVVRGGNGETSDLRYTAAHRGYEHPSVFFNNKLGFRAALWIK